MASDAGTADRPHPSPHRHRVGGIALLFGLAGGPAAWIAQLIVNYGLASFSCYPRGAPRSHVLPGWEWVWPLLLIINLAAIAVAAAAAWIAYRNWHSTRGEHPGTAGHALEAGEGRTRFLGLTGMMTGLGFVAAAVFDTVALFVVPQCVG